MIRKQIQQSIVLNIPLPSLVCCTTNIDDKFPDEFDEIERRLMNINILSDLYHLCRAEEVSKNIFHPLDGLMARLNTRAVASIPRHVTW